MNMFSTISVCDTETTGFPPDASMVQVARTDLRLYPSGWEIESDPVEIFVRPEHPIPPKVSAVHHIVEADCVGGVSQDEAIHFATLGADVVAAHNWEFDRNFIRTRLPYICTLKCARIAWPNMESHSNQAIRYARGLCMTARDRAKPAHRAGFDTWVTAHILIDLLKEMTVEEAIEHSKFPSRLLRMPGGNKHKGETFEQIARDDPGYLRWLIDKSEFSEDVKYSAHCALNGGARR